MNKNRSPRTPSPLLEQAPLLLLGLVLCLAAYGGGMLNDTPPQDPVAFEPLRAVATPLCGVLLAIAAAIAYRQPAPWRRGPAPALFGLFGVWLLVSCAGSVYPDASLQAALLGLTVLAAGAVAARAVRDARGLAVVAVGLMLAVSIAAGIGVNEFLTNLRAGVHDWRVFATFTNPDFLAVFLVTGIPLTAAVFVASRERSVTLLAGLAFLIQTVCLWRTQSRFGAAAVLLALIVLGLLLWRTVKLSSAARRRGFVLMGLMALAVAVGARQLVSRLGQSRNESYSAQFRVYTWSGTQRLAVAHPLHGAGIGTFSVAYPPYATVGFTQHAHNSFVQFAAELGFPGVLLLLAGLSYTGAVGMAAVRSVGTRTATEAESGEGVLDPPVVLAGLVAALTGSVAHNLFDSGLYVPANALALATVCGTLLASARLSRPEEEHGGVVVPAGAGRGVALALSALLGLAALYQLNMRSQLVQAVSAVGQRDYAGARDAYQALSHLDPLDAEAHMRLAELAQNPAEAEGEYRAAVRAADIGKTHYRLGRFLAKAGRTAEAAAELEKSRQRDPHYLDNLLALAEAYRALGRAGDADGVYNDMLALSHSPVGKILAMPEKIDWQYGVAHLQLAEEALARSDRAAALPRLRDGVGILGEFWRHRSNPAQDSLNAEKRGVVTDRYDWGLQRYAEALRAVGQTAEAEKAEKERAGFQADLAREKSAPQGGA